MRVPHPPSAVMLLSANRFSLRNSLVTSSPRMARFATPLRAPMNSLAGRSQRRDAMTEPAENTHKTHTKTQTHTHTHTHTHTTAKHRMNTARQHVSTSNTSHYHVSAHVKRQCGGQSHMTVRPHRLHFKRIDFTHAFAPQHTMHMETTDTPRTSGADRLRTRTRAVERCTRRTEQIYPYMTLESFSSLNFAVMACVKESHPWRVSGQPRPDTAYDTAVIISVVLLRECRRLCRRRPRLHGRLPPCHLLPSTCLCAGRCEAVSLHCCVCVCVL